jgi:hypothetical protein
VTTQAPGDLADAELHLHQAAQAASLLKFEVLCFVPMAIPDIAGVALGLRVNAYDPHGSHCEPSAPGVPFSTPSRHTSCGSGRSTPTGVVHAATSESVCPTINDMAQRFALIMPRL